MMGIAIIDNNMLACMGLERMLKDIVPVAEVSVFRSYEELVGEGTEAYAHFFVSSAVYFEHAQFFLSRPQRFIVLVHGEGSPRMAGMLTLNVNQDEKEMVKSLLQLLHRGHPGHMHAPGTRGETEGGRAGLTPREAEVAVLLAKGLINKEVADRLNISMATVITHRKNIMCKLEARSLADIIIYVVMNGLVRVDEL